MKRYQSLPDLGVQPVLKLFALCAMLALPMSAKAAEITWLAPTDISGGSDVNTDGTQVFGRSLTVDSDAFLD